MTADEMLRLILTSRVYDVARATPLDAARRLSARTGHRVYLKREDLQPIFTYKLRGAYNRIAHLSAAEGARGVITASAGNHAQGVAYAARHLRLSALIVMPQTTPAIKIDAVRDLGAEVQLAGDTYADAKARCDELAAETGRVFVHAFDDPLVIAGQGTIALEVLGSQQSDVDTIFVPVGGGGLIAGIASYVKAVRPDVRVIGVEPFEADAMHRSLAAGRRVTLDHVGIFADGVAVREVGALPFSLIQGTVDEVVRVTNDEICAAIKEVFDDTRSLMEPAGALAVAGLRAWAARQRDDGPVAGGGAHRRQHELRPAALRRRARRRRRGARGAARRHHSRAARRLPRVLRHHRPPRRHRVQLPAERPARSAHLRRRGHPLARRGGSAGRTAHRSAATGRWT